MYCTDLARSGVCVAMETVIISLRIIIRYDVISMLPPVPVPRHYIKGDVMCMMSV